MEIAFLPQASEDLQYWKQKGEKRILKRIRTLLAEENRGRFSMIRFLQEIFCER